MTFDAIVAGQSVFVDANVFLDYFTSHPLHGPVCQKLLDRIANNDISAFTSSAILSEVVHRLMTIEACQRFGWPVKGIARRLRQNSAAVQQLARPRQAVDEISLIGVHVISVVKAHVSQAVDVSQSTGLLSGDATVVTVMRNQGLSLLASNDTDFDRVPGITRYGPG